MSKRNIDREGVLETLGNNQVQSILEDMGMIDENGQCPHTVEEIFKAGVEWSLQPCSEE